MDDARPLIVIPDTHGHLREVEALVHALQRRGYLQNRLLVFLGDYVDRGPHIRELVAYCIQRCAEGHICIAGNHDVTLAQVLTDHPHRDAWIERWSNNYESQTLASYDVAQPMEWTLPAWRAAADALRERMPAAHLEFLTSLPLFYEDDRCICIHAGLVPNVPWDEQRAYLLQRNLHGVRGPSQLFAHKLATTIGHMADKVVVSGHVSRIAPLRTDRRVLLHCGVENGGRLAAWISDLDHFVFA